jgi:hypothetical protein
VLYVRIDRDTFMHALDCTLATVRS